MKEHYFSIYMNYQEVVPYYQGHYHSIIVLDHKGKKVQIPAAHFRPYINSIGLKGRFKLQLTTENKFLALERID